MLQNNSISGLLEQAKIAANQGNWSLSTQYLQQIQTSVSIESLFLESCQGNSVAEDTFKQLLELAQTVLEMGDFYDRWEIAKVFPAFGPPAIPTLIEYLQDSEADWELRWFTARILGEFKHPSVIESLIQLLQTDAAADEDITTIAAEALAILGSPAISTLTPLLEDEATRLAAVKALTQMRHPETIPALLSVATDPQWTVRMRVIEAFGSFHDARVIPVLQAALQDPVPAVRREAIVGLGSHADLINETELLHCLGQCLQDPHLGVKQQAVATLARLRSTTAAEQLFQAMMLPSNPEVFQIEGIRALGWMQTAEALSYLQRFLLEAAPNLAVVREIVLVLGRFKQSELQTIAVDLLLKLCESTLADTHSTELKQALTVSFSELGHYRANDCLIQLMADPDAGVRLHAIAALKKLDCGGANFQRLQQVAHDTSLSPELRQGAVLALQEW